MNNSIIDNLEIEKHLNINDCIDSSKVNEILDKARQLKGLSFDDVSSLLNVENSDDLKRVFTTAKYVKEEIYGKRMVIFAPMYISNLCRNECTYCAFRAKNKEMKRRALTMSEIADETKSLVDSGHKRMLLVAGESYPQEGFSYVLKAIDKIYSVKSNKGSIRRVNINVAPLSTDEFKALKERNIGTYQIFQETYDRNIYNSVHLSGQKADYDWRITAIDRAMEAGIDDVGIGVLFGLGDYKFEVLALLQHIKYLENKFGVGPHTISVPRLEPASGSDISVDPPMPVSDIDFQKIVAILRLAVPYTGIIMSTRETAKIRRETFALGVSQISAGSRTDPGGYSKDQNDTAAQFSLGDHRSLDDVVADVAAHGYVPSFCTGCYRLGRTGADFMDMAKPGEIKKHCNPNGLSTFMEYLEDYASPETKRVGKECIAKELSAMSGEPLKKSAKLVELVKTGKRDVYC